MNYLALARELRREAGLSGTGPTTVIGQTGQLADVVAWVANAWLDIQNISNGHWRWLRRPFSFDSTASVDTYAAGAVTDVRAAALIARFGTWRFTDQRNPPKIFLTSLGNSSINYLRYLPWDSFNMLYGFGPVNPGQPIHVTINPQDEIVLGPAPADVYTVTGEYFRGAQVLSLDTDEPECPPQFHRAIVFKALMDYGYHQVDQAALTRSEVQGREILGRLMAQQLESSRMGMAGPLA